jgi:vacuolar-type H+-ATPase subunit E/Vma4
MEVLKTDDKLKEEIINDANKKAERIISKAKKDIEEMEKSVLIEIENFEIQTKKTVEKGIENETRKIFASVGIEVKKKTLDITGNLIDEVFNSIKQQILENKLYDYRQFILNMIQAASKDINSRSYTVEIGKMELAKITEEPLKSLKLTGGVIKDIVLKEDINGLMLLSEDRKQGVFISIDDYIDRLKEKERNRVFEILLGAAI